MRLQFKFILTQNQIPLDYRKIFISLFKKALEGCDESIKEKYYHKQDPINKLFTFSIFLNNPIFKYDYIELADNNIILNFSTPCYETGIDYYNGLLKMINYAHPVNKNNYLILKNISIVKEKSILEKSIIIKTLSPILARKHNKMDNYDTYLTPANDEFVEIFKQNIKANISKMELEEELSNAVNDFEFIDIGKGKEVKVLFYGHKIIGLVGKYLINGEPKLLDFILKSGIGSRTSSGFGMINLEGVNE